MSTFSTGNVSFLFFKYEYIVISKLKLSNKENYLFHFILSIHSNNPYFTSAIFDYYYIFILQL